LEPARSFISSTRSRILLSSIAPIFRAMSEDLSIF
jgi:hypothetical protein